MYYLLKYTKVTKSPLLSSCSSNSSCIYRIPSACWDTACLIYILLQGDYLPLLGWFTGRYLVVVSLWFISLIVILFYVV